MRALASGVVDSDVETAQRLQRRSLVNLMHMGHCAPTVMQTILDVSGTRAEWLVKMTAGLPGGIGNTGAECGGLTAPLMLLGLRFVHDTEHRRLPVIVAKGHALLKRFAACQGSASCRQIRGDDRLPLQCVGVIRSAPCLYAEILESDCSDALSPEQTEAYAALSAHWDEQNFHCARVVLERFSRSQAESRNFEGICSGFLGGTVFSGMTCSAYTAGVMALGLALGRLETSPMRVLRMLGTMALGGNAFADELNAFNKIMNLGQRLSVWFDAEYGSTECRSITQCDFATLAGVHRYVEGGGTTRCRKIAESVANQVQEMIDAQPFNRLDFF